MIECSAETSVPDWIIDHPETLAVFQELGIDYSCGGKSLEFACREQALPEQYVMAQSSPGYRHWRKPVCHSRISK